MTDAAESNIAAFPKFAILDRFQPADSRRNIWQHVMTPCASVAEAMEVLAEPTYWAKVAKQVRALDRIEVVADDGMFFVELIVLSASPHEGLRLAPLRGVELHGQVGPRGAAPKNSTGIRAMWKGPHLKWCAVRGDEILRDKFETEAACGLWIANHIKQQERRP